MDRTRLAREQRLELTVQSLALGGNGVARLGDLVVFVAGAYPGERVLARVTKSRSHWAEASLVEVLAASPDRVAAPCVHFGRECGGCRSQDLAYPAQVAAKTRQVAETLARVGGLPDVPVDACVPSPDVYRYRNKMEFAFHPANDGTPILGLRLRLDPQGDASGLEPGMTVWVAR